MVTLMELTRIFLWFLPDAVCGPGVVFLCRVGCLSVCLFVILGFALLSPARLSAWHLFVRRTRSEVTVVPSRSTLDVSETFQTTGEGKTPSPTYWHEKAHK